MKKTFYLLAAVVAACVVMGCATVNAPVSATSNTIGSKVGQATGTVYLGFLWGNADVGIQAAAKNGGITKISTVDTQTQTVLGGLIINYTTTVTGE